MKNQLYDLIKIGLTEGEAKVYLALIGLGSSKVGPIVKDSGVAYSNVYDVLQRLMEKGLVTFIIKEKTKYFQAANPSNLLDYLDKREDEILKQRETLKQALPEIEKLQKIKPSSDAEIFIGQKGLKAAYRKLLEGIKPKDEDLFFYIHEKEYAEESDSFYLNNRQLINTPNRGITNKEYSDSPVVKNLKFLNIKFVDFPIPGNLEVCNDRVLLISWKKPMIATLIHSQSIAENIRNYFNSVWKLAKK